MRVVRLALPVAGADAKRLEIVMERVFKLPAPVAFNVDIDMSDEVVRIHARRWRDDAAQEQERVCLPRSGMYT